METDQETNIDVATQEKRVRSRAEKMRSETNKMGRKKQINKKNVVCTPHMSLADSLYEEHERTYSSPSSLEELKEQGKQLLIEKKRLLDSSDQVRLQYDCAADKGGRLLMKFEKNRLSSQGKSGEESVLKLFAIETSGPKFADGMVFTVMAEDHVWAEYMVRQWLDSNGRETDKIDKIQAIVSRNVRAIVNVGSKLLDR